MVYDNKARSRIGGLNPKILLAIFAVAITVTACSAERQSASHEPEGVSFEFRKLVPNATTVDEAEGIGTVRNCETDGHGAFVCRWTKAAVGDLLINDLKSEVGFESGTFAWFWFRFETGDYDRIRKEMTSLYGLPCVDEKKPSAKLAPNAYRNDVRWCFKEGQLMMTEESPHEMGSGALEFFRHQPDPAGSR